MKKILITGITGFVGKHLSSYLLAQKSYEVFGTYRSESSLESLGELKDQIGLKKADLHDAAVVEAIIASLQFDAIFHLAAQASTGKSHAHPIETITNNIVCEFSLLDALHKNNMLGTRVIIISTGEIYGVVRPDDIPVDEETPLRPATPYAVSKIAQDYLGLQYHLARKLDIVRLRPFNHIGSGQREGFVIADFAKQIAEIEKGTKEPEISVGNLEAKRDFTDVHDMVVAYELAMQKGKSGEAYNLGSGRARKIRDILDMLLSLSSKKIAVKVDPEKIRPIDVPEIVCDAAKFQNLTGWKPVVPFERTLQDILDYWRKIV